MLNPTFTFHRVQFCPGDVPGDREVPGKCATVRRIIVLLCIRLLLFAEENYSGCL